MSDIWTEFVQSHLVKGATPVAGCENRIASFGDTRAEYEAIRTDVALVPRTNRALLEVTGSDRAAWLHNLTTNEVNNLGPGEGNYAFATNVKGRILFGLNVLVRAEAIWVDVDRSCVESASRHFDKYTITEDVTVTDRTSELARIGVTGPRTPELVQRIGLTQLRAMSDLGTTDLHFVGETVTALRHDFCGPLGVELFAPPKAATELWQALAAYGDGVEARPAGEQAVELHRIEAGIPAQPHEINEDVLPAETRQLERAVSYHKGCYLGQEVVERMRSRGVVARGLCGLKVSGDVEPAPGSALHDEDGKPVGTVGSACHSPAIGGIIALAYVKTGKDAPGTPLRIATDQGDVAATAAALPFV